MQCRATPLTFALTPWIAGAVVNLPPLHADCSPQWSTEFSSGELDGQVRALAGFDDDPSDPGHPVLYVGGTFTSAFRTRANRIARYDGSVWSDPGGGVFQDVPGATAAVAALAVFDDDADGPGLPRLYAGGVFAHAGTAEASNIASWNGSEWSPLGSGLNGEVLAAAVFDEDGARSNPPALFVGGRFTFAGESRANCIARWNGQIWSPVDSGVNKPVHAMTVFDEDGPGPGAPALYVGGQFTQAGDVTANRVARWDGSAWSAVGSGIPAGCALCTSYVATLVGFDSDGEGPGIPELFAGGLFYIVAGQPAANAARWNGAVWSPAGALPGGAVYALAAFDESASRNGPHALIAVGAFPLAGTTNVYHVARWDGDSWGPLFQPNNGLGDPGRALLVFDDDGSGPHAPALYVGGDFDYVSEVPAGRIARWGIDGPAPVFQVSPADTLASEGAEASLWVDPFWTGPVTFQWRKDGVPIVDVPNVIDGTNAASLYWEYVLPDDAGPYDVVIDNGCGTVTTPPALLTVDPSPLALVADPPLDNPYLPGVQPFRDVLQTGAGPALTQGIGAVNTPAEGPVSYGTITVTFSEPLVPAPTVRNIYVDCPGADPCPTAVAVTGNNPYQVTLSGPIPPTRCTIVYFDGQSYLKLVAYESLPGDVDMDGEASYEDILWLVTVLQNGSVGGPNDLARYDINRSGELSPVDIIRLVQLMNGVNSTQPWYGEYVAPCD